MCTAGVPSGHASIIQRLSRVIFAQKVKRESHVWENATFLSNMYVRYMDKISCRCAARNMDTLEGEGERRAHSSIVLAQQSINNLVYVTATANDK